MNNIYTKKDISECVLMDLEARGVLSECQYFKCMKKLQEDKSLEKEFVNLNFLEDNCGQER